MDGEGTACPIDRQTDGQHGRHLAIVILPLSYGLQQEPLSAATRREGAHHKRTVWLKRSGVL